MQAHAGTTGEDQGARRRDALDRWLRRYLPPFLLMAAGAVMWRLGVHPPTSVPAIANVAGIRVGLDTVRDAEELLGPGEVSEGSAWRSARAWHLPWLGWYLGTDGYQCRIGRGSWEQLEIIELAVLTAGGAGPAVSVPRAHRPRGTAPATTRAPRARHQAVADGVWAVLRPGICRSEVMGAMHHARLRPTQAAHEMEVRAHGFLDANGSTRYRTWVASLWFEGDRLRHMGVWCE